MNSPHDPLSDDESSDTDRELLDPVVAELATVLDGVCAGYTCEQVGDALRAVLTQTICESHEDIRDAIDCAIHTGELLMDEVEANHEHLRAALLSGAHASTTTRN